MTRDLIGDHDRIADVYKYRTPYGDEFFKRLAARLHLGNESRLIDLCCGTGAVAAGLAPFCAEVVAVDGAARMIAHAPTLPNVSYHVHDINSEAFRRWVGDGGVYDFISIGMGIHWLGHAAIADFGTYLRPGGRVLVLATGFAGGELNPWFRDYDRLRKSIIQKENRDWRGTATLARHGYRMIDTLQLTYRARLPLQFFADHLLSFSQEYKEIVGKYDAIAAAVSDCLRKYATEGRVESCWRSSARIYSQ